MLLGPLTHGLPPANHHFDMRLPVFSRRAALQVPSRDGAEDPACHACRVFWLLHPTDDLWAGDRRTRGPRRGHTSASLGSLRMVTRTTASERTVASSGGFSKTFEPGMDHRRFFIRHEELARSARRMVPSRTSHNQYSIRRRHHDRLQVIIALSTP